MLTYARFARRIYALGQGFDMAIDSEGKVNWIRLVNFHDEAVIEELKESVRDLGLDPDFVLQNSGKWMQAEMICEQVQVLLMDQSRPSNDSTWLGDPGLTYERFERRIVALSEAYHGDDRPRTLNMTLTQDGFSIVEEVQLSIMDTGLTIAELLSDYRGCRVRVDKLLSMVRKKLSEKIEII